MEEPKFDLGKHRLIVYIPDALLILWIISFLVRYNGDITLFVVRLLVGICCELFLIYLRWKQLPSKTE